MIFAINTSSFLFSIALIKRNGALIGEYSLFSGPKGGRPLFPALDELLIRSKSDLRDAEAVAVAAGPGSFTGLRVGLSMAKGVCQALEIPLVGVDSLEALASQIFHPVYPICPVIGSRRGEVFAALFRSNENGEAVRVKRDVCIKINDLEGFLEEKTILIGDDFGSQASALMKAAGQKGLVAPCSFWAPKAAPVGMVALRRLEQGYSDDLEAFVPMYLRPPDIQSPSTVSSRR